jgi:hypothetical protein
MADNVSSAEATNHPQSPHISYSELWKQFRADVYGKEVQSAATYSYMWMADQMGHVCVGILVNQILTVAARWLWEHLSWHSFAEVTGLIATVAVVAAWEASTFYTDERNAKGLFPLGRELLRDNAIIATLYMALGGVVGFGFHIGLPWSDVAVIIACTFIAIWLAPRWLRQKIIWQKAALPYLSRLADMEPTMGAEAAKMLQRMLDKGAPPNVNPCQVVIGGPVGSGRTQLATGIGTEFAFKSVKTRYISIQSLLEFASAASPPDFPDDPGPINVNYWPWSESQVIIIDDIGPLIAPQKGQQEEALAHFRAILQDELNTVAGILAKCHTIWVIGDLFPPNKSQLSGSVLNDFAVAVSDYTGGKEKPLVIELKAKPAPGGATDDGQRPQAAARYVPTSRSNGGHGVTEQIAKLVGSSAAR